MGKTAGHILKSNDVKLEGRFHLDVGQIAPEPTKGENVALIVENHPEFAVIEVSCSCGAKTHIRCEYADVQSADQESDQTKIIGENDNAN